MIRACSIAFALVCIAGSSFAATWYRDMDQDAYGDAANSMEAPTQPAGYVADDSDCDDGDPNVYPGAPEIPADGIDQDCDGTDTCYQDGDGDGFGSTNLISDPNFSCTGPGESNNDLDCDDGDPTVFPGNVETCNGVDDNCDGNIDEGASGGSDWYVDSDSDGFGDTSSPSMSACTQPAGYIADNTDCDDSDPNVYPGAPEIPADGIDQDCEGNDTCYQDGDGDGFGNTNLISDPNFVCSGPGESDNNLDCDDGDPAVFPGNIETCNGIDDNCDGNIDEGCDVYEITSITDVGNDQGRQVRIRWNRHDDDAATAVTILSYSVYRRIETGLKTPPGDWDFVLNIPAAGQDEYSTVAPTLCDSTPSTTCLSTFYVRAHTPDPLLFFDTVEAQGFSEDNLAPMAPSNLTAAYGATNVLDWDESTDADFSYFRIYRSTDPQFVSGPSNLLGVTVSPQWQDTVGAGWNYHYRVSTVDFNENESPSSSPLVTTAAPESPQGWRLSAHPNPFNPRTEVSFYLDQPMAEGELVVLDVSGRHVKTLMRGPFETGEHSVLWLGRDDRGQPVASGVFFLRLRAGDRELTRKVVLVR